MDNQWKPISSAPKNEYGEMLGPKILIFNQFDKTAWPAYWGPDPDETSEGRWLACLEVVFDNDKVTHWMPLPPRPNAS